MGNCLERNYSSSEESDEREIMEDEASSGRNRRNRLISSSSTGNRYTSLEEEMSSSTSSLNLSRPQSQRHQHRHRTSSRDQVNVSSSTNSGRGLSSTHSPSLNNYLSQSYGGFTTASSLGLGLSSSFPSSAGGLVDTSSVSQSQQQQQVFYLTPNTQRTADQLTEEEQIKLLKRMTLIQQLPTGSFDENKKHKECVICMIDFEKNDTIKYLPCMHTFHQSCIDTWLLRSLICPSCMEPVDAGLLAAYE